MTYKLIEDRNKKLLLLAFVLTLLLCCIFIYYSGWYGIFVVAYLSLIIFIAKKEIERKRKDVRIEDKRINFYKEVSLLKCLNETSHYSLIFVSYFILLILSLDYIPKEHLLFVTILVSFIALIIHLALIYRFKYALVAFDEGFLKNDRMYLYKDIKKFQLIKTKSNDYIVQMATKDEFISTKLYDEQADQLKTYIQLSQESQRKES